MRPNVEAEYKQAVGDAKATLRAKLDAAEKRFVAHGALLTEKIDSIQAGK